MPILFKLQAFVPLMVHSICPATRLKAVELFAGIGMNIFALKRVAEKFMWCERSPQILKNKMAQPV